MDIIKSCATNLWSTENLVNYNIIKYGHTSDQSLQSLLNTAHELRERNVLCAVSGNELHIVSRDSHDDLQEITQHEYGLDFKGEESLKHCASYNKHGLLDLLALAIGCSLSGTSIQKLGLRRIGRLRWIHCNTEDLSTDATILRLQIDLTAACAVTMVCSECMLAMQAVTQEHAAEGTTVILSPSGVCGKLGRPATIPDAKWKRRICSMLQTEHMVIDDNAAWLLVELEGFSGQFWWPMELCFQIRPGAEPLLDVKDQHCSSTMSVESEDMLTFAESWLRTAGDRQRQIKEEQTKKDSIMHDHDTGSMQDAWQARFDPGVATSPPFQHRADLMNTLSVYPTPPDGMISGATQPSTLSEATVPESRSVEQSDDLFRSATNNDEVLMHSRVRGPSVASSTGPSYRQNVDDLFGEVDTELRDAEIGDDDFDFFDDGDDVAMMDEIPQIPVLGMQVEQHDGASASGGDKGEDSTTSDPETRPLLMDVAAESMHLPLPSSEAVKPDDQASDEPTYKPLSPFDIRERLLPPPIPASVASSTQQAGLDQGGRSFQALSFNRDNGFLVKRQTIAHITSLRDQSIALDNSGSDSSDEEEYIRVPRLPWKKRLSGNSRSGDFVSWEVSAHDQPITQTESEVTDFLEMLFAPAKLSTDSIDLMVSAQHEPATAPHQWSSTITKDRILVAQLLTQQSITCVMNLVSGTLAHSASQDISGEASNALPWKLMDAVGRVLPSLNACDLNALALVKETVRWQSAQVKGQPRPQLRQESTQCLDTQFIPAPYLQFRRGEQRLDVLPPAIRFWDELGLGPIGDGKDIAAYCVAPPSLISSIVFESFWTALAATYQGCNLGTMRIGKNDAVEIQATHLIPHAIGNCDEIEDNAEEIYKALTEKFNLNSSKTGEVPLLFMVDTVDDGPSSAHLCLIFSMLQKLLRGSNTSSLADQLVLQIVPISVFTEADLTHILRVQELAYLAREVYDRVPAPQDVVQKSPLAIARTPSILLTEQLPKRILLQLANEPPSDLLHDNSEMHIAYCKSEDGQWVTFCWLDSSGSAQDIASFCLHESSMTAVAREVMERTVDVLQARPVSWRVIIAADCNILEQEGQCWLSAATAASLPRSALTVTLVTIDRAPVLALYMHTTSELTSASAATPANPVGSFLTPVTTPQGASFPVSPDGGTPSTPNQHDSADADTETHLVDLPDETWRILLNTDVYKAAANPRDGRIQPIAQGVLAKHGETSEGQRRKLPMVAVGLVWTIRVKSSSSGVEQFTIRQKEATLRDILTTYRSHGLLAKARGLVGAGEECVPLHMLCAMRGAAALTGFS